MIESEVASVAEHITASWPHQVVEPALVKQWVEKDFKQLDFMTMILAVDRLRLTQDFQPTTRQLVEMHGHVWVENNPRLPALPPVAEADLARPYNQALRLMTATWLELRSATLSINMDKKEAEWAKRRFGLVNKEIQAVAVAQRDLMPDGPDVVAPPALVAIAVAAQERVREILFDRKPSTTSAPKTKALPEPDLDPAEIF